jgi:peptidoglycan hydrolase CwlO-like protein
MGDTTGDLIPPTPPTPVPDRTSRTKDVRCQFCESTLTATGEVLRLSERAKALRDFEDDVEDLKRDLAVARQEIDDKQKMIEDRDGDIRKLQNDLKKAAKFW